MNNQVAIMSGKMNRNPFVLILKDIQKIENSDHKPNHI